MAKNNKNNRGSSKKASLNNNTSDQKENRPKKELNKPHPNETIAMSKQLLLKKTVQNNSRAKRQSQSKNKVCSNGKTMPSLADLEKLFADTDSDNETTLPKTIKNITRPITTQEMPIVIDTDTLFSPTTRKKITEQANEIVLIIDDTSPNDTTVPPSRKRLKFDRHTLPSATTIASVNSTSCTNYEMTHQHNNIHHSAIYKNNADNTDSTINMKKKLVIDDGNISDNSSDTIEYTLNTSMLQRETISQNFCPLPSTSRDCETFIKNDELFNKSLRESSFTKNRVPIHLDTNISNIPTENIINNDHRINKQPKKYVESCITNDSQPHTDDNDLEIIETPIETIILDEEIIPDNVRDSSVKDTKNIIAIDSKVKVNVSDDDDCIVVTSKIDKQNEYRRKKQQTLTANNGLEYDFIEPVVNITNSTADNVKDEIIDVDALIAQNQTILNQLQPNTKRLGTSNLVFDVDVSTISNNSNCAFNAPEPVINGQSSKFDRTTSGMENIAESHRQTTEMTQANVRTNVSQVTNEITNNRDDRLRISPNFHMVTDEDETYFCNYYDIISNTSKNSSRRSLPNNESRTNSNYLHSPTESGFNMAALAAFQSRIPPSLLTLPLKIRKAPTSQSMEGEEQDAISQMPTTVSMLMESIKKSHRVDPSGRRDITYLLLPPPAKEASSLGDCPICMETLASKVIGSTICGHVFCMRCLQQAITSNKRCPTCRKILNKKNGFHQIFL